MSLAPWILHPPTASGPFDGALLVLWHGAGGDIDQPLLKCVAQAFADRGAHAARARFPYRVAGKKMPDRMPVLIDAARATIAEIRGGISPPCRRLFLGGRSMGGRVASMLAAEGEHVDGLLFLSYPLHPDGQPKKLRDAHLPEVKAPMLFVGGDRDALCRMELLGPVLERLGARATLSLFEGADHGFAKVDPRRVADRAIAWAVGLNPAKESGA